MAEPTLHIGRKISKIRELKGMKQETLANLLGVSQQSISKIEQSADVENLALDKIANALGVTVDAIKNFSEEAVINIISSTLNDNAGSVNNNCTLTFNPIDKWLEVIEENKNLYIEKVALLERLLLAEKEKNDLLKGKQ